MHLPSTPEDQKQVAQLLKEALDCEIQEKAYRSAANAKKAAIRKIVGATAEEMKVFYKLYVRETDGSEDIAMLEEIGTVVTDLSEIELEEEEAKE